MFTNIYVTRNDERNLTLESHSLDHANFDKKRLQAHLIIGTVTFHGHVTITPGHTVDTGIASTAETNFALIPEFVGVKSECL